MNRILVTGSNGYVGRNIVDILAQKNFIIGTGRQKDAQGNCEKYIKWDLNYDEIPESLRSEKIDCIVHAAASLDKNELSEELIYTNCLGTFKIVKLAKECGVKFLIYISGLPVVGNFHDVPIVENVPVVPTSMYHATKAAGELIISQAMNFGIKVTSLRVPSPIGPGMPKNTIVPVFIQRALRGEIIVLQGRGTRKQNYIDVRDLGEAIDRIVEEEGINGIFNVGAMNIISNKELASLCIDCLKSNSSVAFSGKVDCLDDIDWTTDDSKLRTAIGEYQTYTMTQSIRDIARDFL